MAASKKKPVTRNSVIAKSIDTAVSNLEAALEKANKAVVVRTAESKKLLNESRRLRKRRMAQMNRKKRAVAADKKNSTGDTRKALRVVTSELNATNKAITKATTTRQAVLEELAGLKDSQKKLSGYMKVIYAADIAMERSKKKKKARR
jgi:predicted  nucleic acid-binding Zn-ribbon protein